MTGEETLEDALRMRAFECVILEEHSLAEQIQLLRNAEVVVAPHGAGLANIVWADQLRLLVELFLPSYVSDCFAVLAAQLGVEYRYVFTERSEPHIGAETVMRVLDALDAHAPPANSPICRSTDHVRQDVGNSGVV